MELVSLKNLFMLFFGAIIIDFVNLLVPFTTPPINRKGLKLINPLSLQ